MMFVAGAGEDPIEKVEALITDLIQRLQKEASAESSHKEMAKSTEKKEDLEAQVAKHSPKLESAVARSNTLDGEVAELQLDLAALAAQQLKSVVSFMLQRFTRARTEQGLPSSTSSR